MLAGTFAGAACRFEACLTDSFGPLAPINDGLGILPGRFFPHYDTEEGREEISGDLIAQGRLAPGIGLDDGAAVRFADENLAEVIGVAAGRGVHRVG